MWSGISRFFGNLTGGLIGESDAERRRREEQQRKRQASAPARPSTPAASRGGFALAPQPVQQAPRPLWGQPQQQAQPQVPQFRFGEQPEQPEAPLGIMRPDLREKEERSRYEQWKADRARKQKAEMLERTQPFLNEFNKMDGAAQQRQREALERQAATTMFFGDENLRQRTAEAQERLAAIEEAGKDNRNAWQHIAAFGKDVATDMGDWGMNMLEAVRTAVDGGNTFKDNERDYHKGRISRDEFIKRANELNQRVTKLTGGSEDKGLLDRTLRSIGNAAEGASYVIPGVGAVTAKALSPARRMMLHMAKTGLVEGGASGVSSLREGTDTRLSDTVAEASLGALFGVGASGVGAAVKTVKRSLTRNMIRDTEEQLGRPLTREEENQIKREAEAQVDQEVKQVREEQKTREQAPTPETAPEVAPDPTKQPAPGNVDPAYLEELRRRRQQFQEDPEAALELEDVRNREATYDPTEPVNRENIAEKLTQLGVKPSDLRKLNEAGGNARIYQQILEQMEARGFVPDNPVAYIRGALNKIKEQNRYNPTLAAMSPQKRFEPAVNNKGEVITDQNGRPMSKEEYERLTTTGGKLADGETNRMVGDSTIKGERTPAKPVEKAAQIAKEEGKTVNHGKNSEAEASQSKETTVEVEELYDGGKSSKDGSDLRGTPTGEKLTVEMPSQKNIDDYRVKKSGANANNKGYVSQKADIVVKDADGNELNRINFDKAAKKYGTDDVNELAKLVANRGVSPSEKTASSKHTRNTTTDSQGNIVDTNTGEILDSPEAKAKTYRTVDDMVKHKPTELTYGKEKAYVKAVDDYAKRLGDRVEAELKKNGATFDEMVAHIDDLWRQWRTAREAGEALPTAKDIDPKYRRAYQMLRRDLDKMYEFRKGQKIEGRVSDVEGDQGPFYIPHRSVEEGNALSTLDDLNGLNRDHSVLSRTTGEMKGMDTSKDLIRKYAIEMLGNNSVRKADAMVKQSKLNKKAGIGEVLNNDDALRYIDERGKFTQDLEDAAALKNNQNLRKFDVIGRLSELGNLAKMNKRVIDAKMDNAFYKEADRRLGTVQVDGKPIDQRAGIQQHYRAASDAHALVDSKPKQLGIALKEHIRNDLVDLTDAEVDEVVKNMNRKLSLIPSDVKGEALKELQTRATTEALRDASKVNYHNFLMQNDIVDPNLKTVLNIHARNILVAGRAKADMTTKIASFIANAQDMALRGWNFKSAAVEFSDVSQTISTYGVKITRRAAADVSSPKKMMKMLRQYGRENSYAVHREILAATKLKSNDLEDFYKALEANQPDKVMEYMKKAADPRMMLKSAETWKQAVALRAAEIKFAPQAKQKGWSKVEYQRRVLHEARRVALVNDQESFLPIQQNPVAATSLQYWQWNLRFMAQNGRLLTGREDLGMVKDGKSRARFAAYQLAQRTALWTALSASGSSVAYAFGVFDPFGIFEGGWDGIDEADKTNVDTVMEHASVSPVTSLVGSAYFAYRQEQERADAFATDDERRQGIYGSRERKAENDRIFNGEELTPEQKEAQRQDNAKFDWGNVAENFNSRTPFGNMLPGTTQAKKTITHHKNQERGYAVARDGRVQHAAAQKGSLHDMLGYIFGPSVTKEAREYRDRPEPLEAIKKADFNGFVNELRKDPFFETGIGKLLGGTTKRPERPLSSSFDGGFNQAALKAFEKAIKDSGGVHTEESRKALTDWIAIGRKYNRVLDDFKRDKPHDYAKWQETFDDNIISPEKWSIYAKNPKIYEFTRERKQLEAKHLGRVVDPVFELDAKKAKVVMEERSMLTGDDMKQRTLLYNYEWYGEFKKKEQAYYAQFESEDADQPNRGERAKKWFDDSKALYELRKDSKRFPAVAKFYEIQEKHGYESDEMKAFWDTPEGEAYTDQKIKYDEARLEIVNRMRGIEGAGPLTWEQFRAKIEFEEVGEDDGKTSGYTKNGKFYKTGGRKRGSGGGGRSGSTKKKTFRTGVEDTVSRLGDTPSAMKQVKIELAPIKDARKAVKRPRASGRSKIRVRI